MVGSPESLRPETPNPRRYSCLGGSGLGFIGPRLQNRHQPCAGALHHRGVALGGLHPPCAATDGDVRGGPKAPLLNPKTLEPLNPKP